MERMPRSLRMGIFVLFAIQTAFVAVDYLIYPIASGCFLPDSGLSERLSRCDLLQDGANASARLYIRAVFAGAAMLLAVIFGTGGARAHTTPASCSSSLGTGAWCRFPEYTPRGSSACSSRHSLRRPSWLGPPRIGTPTYLAFFLSAAGFESVMSAALLDGIRYRDFFQRHELEQARDNLRELDRAKSRFHGKSASRAADAADADARPARGDAIGGVRRPLAAAVSRSCARCT